MHGPCPSPVTLTIDADATCTTGVPDRSGSAALALARRCDGSAQTASVTVRVATALSGTARLTFDFVIATRC